MVIKANPEKDWHRFGELDPYYGVLSSDGLKYDKITEEAKDKFFASGVRHIQICLGITSRIFNFRPEGQALDFGCGVGRLICAMAPYFSEVVGLDIAPGMLAEARIESTKRGWNNIVYDLSTDESRLSSSMYNFVHTYLVLQHIPISKGEHIIEKMLSSLKVRGIGAIHLTYGASHAAIPACLRNGIKNFLPLRAIGNFVRGKRWDYPTMQMNNYNLSKSPSKNIMKNYRVF